MPPRHRSYVTELTSAVDAFDRERVEALCDELERKLKKRSAGLAPADAAEIMRVLRRKRHFTLTEAVGGALVAAGYHQDPIWLHYAQALIELKNMAGALALLSRVARTAADGSNDQQEALGLTARAYKQHFVDAPAGSADGAQALVESLRLYLGVYDRDDSAHWHGINAVATACRAKREGIGLPAEIRFDPATIAAKILDVLSRKGDKPAPDAPEPLRAFDLATAVECCVALERWPEALLWADRYLNHPKSDAFEIGSTLRQFTEIWGLGPLSPEGSSLIVLLQAKLLARQGGQVTFTSDELSSARARRLGSELEAKFSSEDMLPLRRLREGIARCQGIAMIARGAETSGFGTGFVVSAREIGYAANDELLLLTNAHVVSQGQDVHNKLAAEPPYRPPLWPDRARVQFSVTPKRHQVEKVLFTSPPWELDCSLLRLTPPIKGRKLCPLDLTQRRIDTANPRVFVIGHPGGRELSFSLSDNQVLGFKDPRLHYRTPTEGGSSGSPVFTADWNVLALHHAGSETMATLDGKAEYPANEGIWIQSIRKAMKKTRRH